MQYEGVEGCWGCRRCGLPGEGPEARVEVVGRGEEDGGEGYFRIQTDGCEGRHSSWELVVSGTAANEVCRNIDMAVYSRVVSGGTAASERQSVVSPPLLWALVAGDLLLPRSQNSSQNRTNWSMTGPDSSMQPSNQSSQLTLQLGRNAFLRSTTTNFGCMTLNGRTKTLLMVISRPLSSSLDGRPSVFAHDLAV